MGLVMVEVYILLRIIVSRSSLCPKYYSSFGCSKNLTERGISRASKTLIGMAQSLEFWGFERGEQLVGILRGMREEIAFWGTNFWPIGSFFCQASSESFLVV